MLAFLESCTGTNINCDILAIGVPRSHLGNLHHGINSGTCLICSGKGGSDPPFHLVLPVFSR